MTTEQLGKNLIFLISQPRAGSTLTQRILGSHPDIHTVSEPWLMLHPLYSLRPEWYETEYNAWMAQEPLQGFFQELPEGEETYIKSIRRMYAELYEYALKKSGKSYFLDKTPRYYFILPELYRTFPDAKFIILLRNPLAVLCSIIKSWTKEEWFRLHVFKNDLIKAPSLLLNGINLLDKRCVILQYERMLRDPEDEIKKVFEKLNCDFLPEMINYGESNSSKWILGDQGKVYQKTKPEDRNLDQWIDNLTDPQIWRIANDYLEILGEETINQMGYSYVNLKKTLKEYQPSGLDLSITFPFHWIIRPPRSLKKIQYEKQIINRIRSIQKIKFNLSYV